jgi:RHH-type rel operon transcriptional repressor/antitoxin RelB
MICMLDNFDPRDQAETNEWQIREIRSAVAEADAGDFASDADVNALITKWNGHAKP